MILNEGNCSESVRMGKGGWDGEERWIKNIFVPHSSTGILELLLFKFYYIITVFITSIPNKSTKKER